MAFVKFTNLCDITVIQFQNIFIISIRSFLLVKLITPALSSSPRH